MPNKIIRVTLAALIVAGFPVGVVAQNADDNWERCGVFRAFLTGAGNPDITINACTAVIQSHSVAKEDLATALNNRGAAYARKGDYDQAIQDFTQAIRANPSSAPAFNNRASAYIKGKGNFDLAIKDLDRIIQMIRQGQLKQGPDEYAQPNEAVALDNRGYAYYRKGDFDRAIQDFDEAIRSLKAATQNPDRPVVIFSQENFFIHRANAEFIQGRFAEATADFKEALANEPSRSHIVLWMHIAANRAGQDDSQDFKQRASQVDPSRWPGAAMKLYLGQMTGDQLLTASSDSDPATEKSQRCQALFFLAEYEILEQHAPQGISRLKDTLNACPKDFLQYLSATAELTRIKQ